MLDIVPMLVPEGGYDSVYGLNPSSCIKETMLKLISMCVSSGSGTSPSRYCMTCCMLGLMLVNGCNLKKECTKGKHICERGCLTCAYQFWGKVPHGTDHMRCL
uniref:Uncharacterized protein n=1 Tax=Oryza punctata TaxID=4537 RepID=A0A0E0LGV8_ORYPU